MKTKRPYWQVAVSLLLSLLATAAFLIFCVKAITLFMPFVIGWIISVIATPLVNWLEKRLKIVKKFGSALIVVLVLALIVVGLYFGVSKLVKEIGSFVRNMPDLFAQVTSGLHRIGNSLSGMFDRLPEDIQNGLTTLMTNLGESATRFVSNLSQPTVTAAGNLAKNLPASVIAFIVSVMSAYFFIVYREIVLDFLNRVAPISVKSRMALVVDNLRYAIGGYFKAQLQIMGVVFLIVCIGLAIVSVRYFVLIALLIGFLDFLPFFGTGTAMIPWALYQVLVGNYKTAVILSVTYILTQLVRHLLQPKLMADNLGMNPLVALILLYLGYRVRGILGMILAVPVGMVAINIYKAGAFDYIINDFQIILKGILSIRNEKETEGSKNDD